MKRHLLILILFAVFADSEEQDYSKWCPNIATDVQDCFSQSSSGLYSLLSGYSFFSYTDWRTLLGTPWSKYCRYEESINVIFKCYRQKLDACLPQEQKDRLADVNSFLAGVKLMCKNYDSLDESCVRMKSDNLSSCMEKSNLNQFISDSQAEESDLSKICRYYSANENCTRNVFVSCKDKTADILADAINYNKPMGCGYLVLKPSLMIMAASFIFLHLRKN